MPIELKNLPSLIAIPYSETLKKDSIQRKDFQRLVLENALTLNSIIAISDFYNHNRKSSDDSEKKLNSLPNVPNIDLGQISVGTWNMFSREFSRVLKTEPKSVFLNNIVDLYHGSTAKEWENLAGSLISIRNKDAHGELIAADKLSTELDKRQEIIDKFVSILDFYKDYKLIVPTSTTLEGGKVVYGCKDFTGILESSIKISNSKDDLELMRAYLYNTKTNNALCLNPMIVAYPISHENKDVKLYVYSKTINKKLGNLHYLSLDSSKDFISDNTEIIGDYFTQSDICSEFQSFRIIVEDPSLHDQKKPALSINRKLSNDFISKDEIIEMLISIKNEGETSADNLKINLIYPESNFRICNKDGELLNGKNIVQEIIGEDISLDSGQTYDLKFYFKAMDSGQYEFPGFTISYEYTDYQGNIVKPKTDKDGASINIETIPSIYCTIYDPSDPFSLAPVININMSVDFGADDKGNKRIFAYIGETIPLTITITNQGLGVAKDVDFTVFVPDAITMDQTNTNWKGNINPLQQVMKTYDLKLSEPGIHSLVVREIVYANQDNKVFETRGGAYNILVRNKPEVQYRQLMQKV